jgi:adenylate cyclase
MAEEDTSSPPQDRQLDPYRFQPEPTMSAIEVAKAADMDYEDAQRLNRALGFPDVDEDDVQFNERDVGVLKGLKAMLGMGIPFPDLIAVARVYGHALAGMADAETRLFRKYLVEPLYEQGKSTSEVEDRLDPIVQEVLDTLGDALDYGHRRHLAMALQNLTTEAGPQDSESAETVAIGFVDLVDFSRLADELHGTELGEVVDRFEDVVVDATGDPRVRIVKMIGDAAMIASRDAKALLDSALEVIEQVRAHENLPQARTGIDLGGVVPLGGDFFGRPVNVAARVVAFARPGTTVVTESFLEAIGEDTVQASKIGSHRLKGVGRVKMFKINNLVPPD